MANVTPNLGLHIRGPVATENAANGGVPTQWDFDLNMALIDAAVGGGGGTSVLVNGVSVSNPNFNGTTPSAPAGNTNVTFQVSGASVSAYVPNAPVSSVAGRTGAITLAVADVSGAAPLASPSLTGNPVAPTPSTGDSSTSIATTAFVKNQSYVTAATAPVTSVATKTGAVTLVVADVSGAAPLASPTFTGSPAAPTPATGDNSTLLATTAFVKAQAYATLASPIFTGTPAAPTPVTSDNSTTLATTAYVQAQGYVTAATAPVKSVFGRTGVVVAAQADYTLDQIGASTSTAPVFNFGALSADMQLLWSSIKGLFIANTTAATSSVDQNSSRLTFDSKVWNTTIPGSFSDQFTMQLVHGSTTAHEAELTFSNITNNGVGTVSGLAIAGNMPRLRFYGSSSGQCTLVPGTTAATLTCSVPINATTGFRIGNAAASGNVLRGNGTNFVAAVLAAADLSNGVTGSGAVVLATAPTVSALTVTGKITSYNARSTAGNGVVSEVFQSLNASLSANFNGGAAQTLFTPTVAGMWRISAVEAPNVTATGATLPSLTVGWTDAGGVARTFVLLAATSTSASSTYVQGSVEIYTNGSTAVTVTSAAFAAGSGTSLTYNLAITAEQK